MSNEKRWNHIRLAVSRPALLAQYLRREETLARLLGERRDDAHNAMNESRKLIGKIFEKAGPAHNLALTPLKCQLLYAIVRMKKPSKVVETGVSEGVSSTLILSALERNGAGRLSSIDVDPNVGRIVPGGLRHRWRLVIGSSREKLRGEVQDGQTDVFFHDSDHSYENMLFEFNECWPHLPAGGILVCDDANWNNAFIHFCSNKGARNAILYGLGVAVK